MAIRWAPEPPWDTDDLERLVEWVRGTIERGEYILQGHWDSLAMRLQERYDSLELALEAQGLRPLSPYEASPPDDMVESDELACYIGPDGELVVPAIARDEHGNLKK